MHETGCSGLVPWDDPEGWDGKGGWSGVQDEEHMYTHGCVGWQKPPQYCKAISFQLNKFFLNVVRKELSSSHVFLAQLTTWKNRRRRRGQWGQVP